MSEYVGYLKIKNGSVGDVLLPKTRLANIIDITYNVANGICKLGSDGKVQTAQLPDSVFDGTCYYGAIDASTGVNTSTIFTNFGAKATGLNRSVYGMYAIFSVGGVITVSTGHTLATGEGGTIITASNTFTVQTGDRIIADNYDSTNSLVRFSIVQSTYQDATTALKGITKLSSITSLTGASGNNVITDSILYGLLDSSPTSGNTGKFLSSSVIKSSLDEKLDLSGGTMTGSLDINGSLTVGDINPLNSTISIGYVDDPFLKGYFGTLYENNIALNDIYSKKLVISSDGTIPSSIRNGDLYFDIYTA